MEKRGVARKTAFLSLFAAAGVFALCSAFGYSLLRSQLYANRLLAHNYAQQVQSDFFTALRQERFQDEGHHGRREGFERKNPEGADFEDALEAYPALGEKISGIGLYAGSGRPLYRYGDAPAVWDHRPAGADAPFRNYLMDEEGEGLRIITVFPPSRRRAGGNEEKPVFFVFSVRQNVYKTRNRAAWLVFAGWEIFLAFAAAAARSLFMKNRAYRQKLQEQKELVALGSAARTLAHEIKNPLSAIQLQADIIDRVCREKVSAETRAISQEVGRLKRLTDKIGDFLRDPWGAPRPLDLAAFTGEFLRHSGMGAAFSGEGELWVSADPDRLQSIIGNLLRNAEESESAPEALEAKLSRAGNQALLEILDRGRGLPPGDPERLFDPFFSTKSRGSGVGLAIARRFAEAAGGSLKIENREGGGVRALLALPLAFKFSKPDKEEP
ncbi:MAG: HAMP domain-containing histidine kinase [Spirochaetia bacterium]|nr:HAMP domain-containing histidine kinase [Spirochaetia bacterium]